MGSNARKDVGLYVAVAGVALALAVLVYHVHLSDLESHATRSAKQQKREQQRVQRRQRKDIQLERRKHERAKEREQIQQTMTDEQKREQMERIKMQRVEQYQKLEASLSGELRVVVDLAFAANQTTRECHSVMKQLGCVYGYMKKCPLDQLISLQVASCSGDVAAIAQHHGVSSWKIRVHEGPLDRLYTPEEIVYLSPDATEVLREVDPRFVYVVGGIVDRSVRKGESITKATMHRFRTMRLPLAEYLDVRKPVLNIDSVIIALNEVYNHNDWSRALERAVPKRLATAKSKK
ncbi:hypothetical protein Poli38472_000650 [Pythium oligandrum]|uniref:tRNA (guanine(9)-N(1))-methyltransferase n=1 Tax=Pythium oligandrum TaxID=41045 RepID=A0A8K1CDI3_PYTOL|nr:hypothetical protein Poli38472_000650 [Pythium oligandrum]|eukprot:TMW60608.1 hypothetical protein Poli38472_000650 [Pythium oligandrum]